MSGGGGKVFFWEGIVYDAEDSDNIIDPYSEGVSAFFESGGK